MSTYESRKGAAASQPGKPQTVGTYLAIFAIVLALPLLLGVAMLTARFVSSERSRLEAVANSANQEILSLVDRELRTRAAILETLAATIDTTGPRLGLEQTLRELFKHTGNLVILFDPSGRQVVNPLLPPGVPLPSTYDSGLLRDVVENRSLHVSDIILDPSTSEPRTQVAIPLLRGDVVVGILSSIIETQRLTELLRMGLPNGPFLATILDRNGLIVARSVNPREFVGRPLPALAQASREQQGTASFVNGNGTPIFAFYRRSPISGWVVAAAVEQATLTAPLIQSLLLIAATGLGLAVSAVGGAWWIGRKLTRAHTSLMRTVEEVGLGRITTPPPTALREVNAAGYALARASRSLSRHAEDLQQSNRRLEQRVEARTRELAAKTALFATTLRTIEQGLIVIDADGRIPVCNPRARRMLGLPDRLMDDGPTVERIAGAGARRGEPLAPEIATLLKPDMTSGSSVLVLPNPQDAFPGETVIEVWTVPLPKGAGIVRTLTDITNQRTHTRELEEARDAAEQASRAKTDFVSTMSHEMRTPLNAMIGYSELLLADATLSPTARRSCERIQRAGAALLCLVDDVLEIGRMDAGIIDVREEPFSLRAVIDDAFAMVSPAAVEKGIELTTCPDAPVDGFFKGDPRRLRQVLLNLLNNAVKFTHAGGVELSIGPATALDAKHARRFTVRDTGIGIAKERQKLLFKRFQQTDPTIHLRFGGVGLGLAITKQIVEHMGGAIGVESDVGQGAAFWFELVLEPTTFVEAAVARDHRPPGPSLNVLVAEDVTVSQELLRELLEAAGHSVDVVGNGVEAVAAVTTGVYDLVLMDVSMPEMDGLAATRMIRGLGTAASRTPIVACTANVFPAQVTAFQNAGVDGYLRKPLLPVELYATIDRIFAPKHLKEPEEAPSFMNDMPDTQAISILGSERIASALREFMDELTRLLIAAESTETPPAALGSMAHRLISSASVFGLTELAQICCALEDACREGHDLAKPLRQLKPVARHALLRIEELSGANETSAAKL